MATVIGLTLAKINGIWRVDVKGARWSDKRAVTQHVTGAGVVESVGKELVSGSFEEVIPKQKQFNWRALADFSIEIFDQETQKIVVFAAEGCNWEGIDGSTALEQAATGKTVAWKGTVVTMV